MQYTNKLFLAVMTITVASIFVGLVFCVLAILLMAFAKKGARSARLTTSLLAHRVLQKSVKTLPTTASKTSEWRRVWLRSRHGSPDQNRIEWSLGEIRHRQKKIALDCLCLLLVIGLVLFYQTRASSQGHPLPEMKFAVTGVLHPYFDPMEKSTKDYMVQTGIPTIYRATQHFDQDEANAIIDGLVNVGFNGFAMWPGHPSAVNNTITKLVGRGCPVILITGPAQLPTSASMCIATDVGASAAEATEHLIRAMGSKGNIVNLIGQVNDPNVSIRKKAIEGVIKKYPQIQLLTQLTEIDDYEVARIKIGDFLTARGDEVDGLVCTAYLGTVVTAEILTEQRNRRIKFIGIDDDPVVIHAIKEGYVTGTMTQSPYGQAFLALEGLRLLKHGYKVKKGVYFINSGYSLVNQNNVDNYKAQIEENAKKMMRTFATDYFDAPDKARDR